jgi:hypothetical protein
MSREGQKSSVLGTTGAICGLLSLTGIGTITIILCLNYPSGQAPLWAVVLFILSAIAAIIGLMLGLFSYKTTYGKIATLTCILVIGFILLSCLA